MTQHTKRKQLKGISVAQGETKSKIYYLSVLPEKKAA